MKLTFFTFLIGLVFSSNSFAGMCAVGPETDLAKTIKAELCGKVSKYSKKRNAIARTLKTEANRKAILARCEEALNKSVFSTAICTTDPQSVYRQNAKKILLDNLPLQANFFD